MYHRNKHPISTVMFSNIHFETTHSEIFKCSTIDEVVNSIQTMKLLLLYKLYLQSSYMLIKMFKSKLQWKLWADMNKRWFRSHHSYKSAYIYSFLKSSWTDIIWFPFHYKRFCNKVVLANKRWGNDPQFKKDHCIFN